MESVTDQGSLAGFPLRKTSSRFSAGPRSQASFAAPSVAASGRSIQSSVITSSRVSRTNFPPPGGSQAISPPFGGGKGGDSGSGIGIGAGLGGGDGGEDNKGIYALVDNVIKAKEAASVRVEGGAVAPPRAGIGSGGAEGGVVGGASVATAVVTVVSSGRGATERPPGEDEVKTELPIGVAGVRAPGSGDGGGDGDGDGQPGTAAVVAAAAAEQASAGGAETGAVVGIEGANMNGGKPTTGRPSLDSAAGSVAVSSIVVPSGKYPGRVSASHPGSVAVEGAADVGGAGMVAGSLTEVVAKSAVTAGADVGDGCEEGGRRVSVAGKHDDDSASHYTGSFKQEGASVVRGEDGNGNGPGTGPTGGRHVVFLLFVRAT